MIKQAVAFSLFGTWEITMPNYLINIEENEEFGEPRNAKFQHFCYFPRRVWGVKPDFTKSENSPFLKDK